MISKEEALEIAKKIVPDIESRMSGIYDSENAGKRFIYLDDKDCYIIKYTTRTDFRSAHYLMSSAGIVINKNTGKVIYHGSLHDEG